MSAIIMFIIFKQRCYNISKSYFILEPEQNETDLRPFKVTRWNIFDFLFFGNVQKSCHVLAFKNTFKMGKTIVKRTTQVIYCSYNQENAKRNNLTCL